jgi:subtilisin family serine protease
MRVTESDVERLRSLPGVAAVHPDRPVRGHVDRSVPLVGAHEVWAREDAAGHPVRGRGVTVAVLDTGVDYSHPDLGGGFGPGHRVVAGYDFANDDADPMDDNGHGTHVAGIVAGAGKVVGVAPEATLTAYKVLDGFGGGYESWIIAGIEAAADPANPHRADVVNLSLGGPGDGTDPVGRAATAATRAGVVVVASAGNSGPAAYTVGSPAVAEGVVSVGASVSGLRLPTARLEAPVQAPLQTYRAGISADPPSKPVTGEVVSVGMASKEDLDRAGDLRGKIVKFFTDISPTPEWTPPPFIELARELERRGVIAALTYRQGVVDVPAGRVDGRPGKHDSGDDFRMDKLVILGMDPTQNEELNRFLARGPVRVSISGTDVTDQMASFSSRGPATTFAIKPDLVAPGMEIRSTWPTNQWAPGEFRLSGTSMAAPHVAGAAALLRQARPELTPAQVRSALVGSAKGLPDQGPTDQGGGRLDVAAAVSTGVLAEPANLSLGLADIRGRGTTAHGQVVIHNLADRPASVRFATSRAPQSVGTAAVNPRQATIPAGGRVTVTVAVAASGLNLDRDSELSGWLTGDVGGTGADLRVPYLLAVRPLAVQAAPDPSDGTTEAFVWSPAPLRAAPTVRVVPARGKPFEVAALHAGGSWYRARINVDRVGAYQVQATAVATGGQHLTSGDAFEVVAPEHRPDGDRWEPVGPNSNAWELTTIPRSPQRGILRTPNSAALWLTDDRGGTWRRVDRLPVARGGRGSVVVDPRDDSRIWYAVNGQSGGFFNQVFDPTYAGRILYTEDRGRTWQILDFPDQHIFALLGASDGRTLVAVTADGYHVSQDRGRTWTAYKEDWGVDGPTAALNGDNLVVAGLRSVLVVAGVTGEPQPARPVHTAKDAFLMAMRANDSRAVLAQDDGSVWVADDASKPWRKVADPPTTGVAIGLVGEDIYLGSYQNDFVSQDGGESWRSMPKPALGAIDTDFDVWPDRPATLLVSAEHGGLFATQDGGASFTRVGVPAMTAYDVAVGRGRDGGETLIANTDSDTYRRPLPTGAIRPGDAEWGTAEEGRITGARGLLASSPANPRVVWKTLYYPFLSSDELQRSEDGGATWTGQGQLNGRVHSMLAHPTDSRRVVIGLKDTYGSGLAVTRDGGTTWKRLYHQMEFDAVAADPAKPDRLWLGSASGLYRSDDFGQTLTRVTGGRVTAVHAGAGGQLVVGGDEIRVSGDAGRRFTVAETGGLPMRVSDIVAVPGRPHVLYAATDAYHTATAGLPRNGRGVLASTDGGRTWRNVSGGLQATSVTSLAISGDGRWLFAGTVDAGVHRLRIR